VSPRNGSTGPRAPSTDARDPWRFPFWIAHRGAGLLAPENTLAAFRLGASHGYRAFECDVKLSADGVPFLLHDATLDRTSSGTGQARDLTWADLSTLDAGGWHSRAYAGEPPARLRSILEFVTANGYALDVEIKPSPGHELETGSAVGRMTAEFLGGATAPTVIFSSFRPESLLGARETAPHVPRALLLDSPWRGWFSMAGALECAAVITNHELMDTKMLRRIRDRGMRALVYTVNDPGRASKLIAMGVDGIVTDAVDRLSPAL